MTTENILKRIKVIANGSKQNSKIRALISLVENKIHAIPEFEKRDSLEEQLTKACCKN